MADRAFLADRAINEETLRLLGLVTEEFDLIFAGLTQPVVVAAFAHEALGTLGDNDGFGVLYHDKTPMWASDELRERKSRGLLAGAIS